jgi:hypothetical protein
LWKRYLRAFEAERGEVLSKADKNLMKLMKHAFDAGALHNVASRQYILNRRQPVIWETMIVGGPSRTNISGDLPARAAR